MEVTECASASLHACEVTAVLRALCASRSYLPETQRADRFTDLLTKETLADETPGVARVTPGVPLWCRELPQTGRTPQA